ncbi:Calponin-homology (CH) domain-containing protein [Aphelenchoides bicaudatus]|nr:Calponin-homology (CH) domain-containing protein [Aphelenchoides bicaudatus]
MTDILEMSHQNVENVDPELNYNASETGQNVIDPEDKPDIDEKRQRRNVEYYGKRLTEVRNWLADCLGEQDIPPAYELEEHLRSGILLARLANYFSPETVSLDKIFDLNGTRYQRGGLAYRHTDNIIKWRKACQAVKLNSIVLPDPSDIYSGRNVRTIFALLSLARCLYRLKKAPPLRECSNLILTDEAFDIIAERVEAAAEAEGVDWDAQIQQENHSVDSPDLEQDRASLLEEKSVIEEVVEVPENSFQSLRQLCKNMNVTASIYDEDFSIEDQKARLNKLLESNEALKIDLSDLEEDIGLLVKNFRSIKDNSDKKAEQDRKQEIEKACQMQASSTQNLSEDSVYEEDNSNTSSYEGDEPRSVAQLSRQTVESRSHEERVQFDFKLVAKANILTLLNANIGGDSIKELANNADFTALDNNMHNKLEDAQKVLDLTLQKLVEQRQLADDGTFEDLLASIFWDIRHEEERKQMQKERKEQIDTMMANASKNAQQMLAQIESYRNYEQTCLKNMTGGGTPSINLADLNKKVKKFLNRREKQLKKGPIKMNATNLIKKKILYMDDITVPKQVAKYSMIIEPLDEPGTYLFQSILDGKVTHSQNIVFEQLLRNESLGHFRMPFSEPLVLDCLGLRRYLDRKFHAKSFT